MSNPAESPLLRQLLERAAQEKKPSREYLSEKEQIAVSQYLEASTPLTPEEAQIVAKSYDRSSIVDILKTLRIGSQDLSFIIEERRGETVQYRSRNEQRHAQDIPRYIVNQRGIGSGGMGTVLMGYDFRMARRVALKHFTDQADTPARRELLKREAQSQGQVETKGVVPVYDFIELPTGAYMVMSFIDPETSPTIGDILNDPNVRVKTGIEFHGKPVFGPEMVLYVLESIEPALSRMAQENKAHLDLKPENIFLVGQEALITDFGVATDVMNSQDHNGTLRYNSPELFYSEAVDARSDQYSLALIIYHMLTGEHVYAGNLMPDIVRNLMKFTGDVNNSIETNQTLDDLCNERGLNLKAMRDFFKKALNRDKSQRFKNPQAFVQAFRSAISAKP